MKHQGKTIWQLEQIVADWSPKGNVRGEYRLMLEILHSSQDISGQMLRLLQRDFSCCHDAAFADRLKALAVKVAAAAKQMEDEVSTLVLEDDEI
jgi:hypothetical protein